MKSCIILLIRNFWRYQKPVLKFKWCDYILLSRKVLLIRSSAAQKIIKKLIITSIINSLLILSVFWICVTVVSIYYICSFICMFWCIQFIGLSIWVLFINHWMCLRLSLWLIKFPSWHLQIITHYKAVIVWLQSWCCYDCMERISFDSVLASCFIQIATNPYTVLFYQE